MIDFGIAGIAMLGIPPIVGILLLIMAAETDWKERRIPNNTVFAVACIGVVTTILEAWLGDGIIGVTVKLINIAVFLVPLGLLGWLKAIKPGDIKLFAAAALFSAMQEGPVYLFFGMAAQMLVIIPILIYVKKCSLIRQFPMAVLFPIPVIASYLLWCNSLL